MIPAWFRRELRPGDHGDDVIVVQRKVGAPITGAYDDETEARVRGVQMSHGQKPTGEVDEAVAEVLGEESTRGLVPEWFTGELQLWSQGPAVCAVRCRLGLTNPKDDRYDPDVEKGVRRFQSGHGLPVTGLVDETTAIELGECVCAS